MDETDDGIVVDGLIGDRVVIDGLTDDQIVRLVFLLRAAEIPARRVEGELEVERGHRDDVRSIVAEAIATAPRSSTGRTSGPRGDLGLGPVVEIAERWRRVVGFVIDQAVLSFVVSFFSWALLRFSGGEDASDASRALAFLGGWTLGTVVVFVIPVARTGRTVGKVVLSMRVIDDEEDALVSWSASLVRAGVPGVLLLIPFTVGRFDPTEAVAATVWIVSSVAWVGVYAVAVWQHDVRGLHDLAAGSIVVLDRRQRLPRPRPVDPLATVEAGSTANPWGLGL